MLKQHRSLSLSHEGSSPTGVLSQSVVCGFKASCMGRRALTQHIKQELIICQSKWQRERKAFFWMARQEKRKVIMLPTSLHLKNSVLILVFPFATEKWWPHYRRATTLSWYYCHLTYYIRFFFFLTRTRSSLVKGAVFCLAKPLVWKKKEDNAHFEHIRAGQCALDLVILSSKITV